MMTSILQKKIQRAEAERLCLLRRLKKLRKLSQKLGKTCLDEKGRRQGVGSATVRSKLRRANAERSRLRRLLAAHRRRWRRLRLLTQKRAESLGLLNANPQQRAEWRQVCVRRSLSRVNEMLDALHLRQITIPSFLEERRLEVEQWIQTEYDLATRRARRRLGEDGRDVVHQAFRNAVPGFPPDRGQFRIWMFGVLSNLTNDKLRTGYRRGVHLPLESHHMGVEQPDNPEERPLLLRSVVIHALRHLSFDGAGIITAFHVLGVSIKALAAEHGENLGTIKMRLKRARCRLKNALRKAGCFSTAEVEALGDRILLGHSVFPRRCPKGRVSNRRQRRRIKK